MYSHWLLSVKAIEVAFYKETGLYYTVVGNQTSIYFGIVAAIRKYRIDMKIEDLYRQHSSSSTDQTLFQTQAKPRRGAGRGRDCLNTA